MCSGPDGCLRVKVQPRCLFHFSSAVSLRLALYDECESCPGQVNSKQLWSAACTACSVSVIHSFISLQQSPPQRSIRALILTHFSISLALALSFSLSRALPPPLPSLHLSSSCAIAPLTYRQFVSSHLCFLLSSAPSFLLSVFPVTSRSTGSRRSETPPEPGRPLEVLDSWSAERIKWSGQLADDQSESGSQDWLVFIERIGRLCRNWPSSAGRGQEASGLFCVMWKPAPRVSERRSVSSFQC